jgi:hypothetical protein
MERLDPEFQKILNEVLKLVGKDKPSKERFIHRIILDKYEQRFFLKGVPEIIVLNLN